MGNVLSFDRLILRMTKSSHSLLIFDDSRRFLQFVGNTGNVIMTTSFRSFPLIPTKAKPTHSNYQNPIQFSETRMFVLLKRTNFGQDLKQNRYRKRKQPIPFQNSSDRLAEWSELKLKLTQHQQTRKTVPFLGKPNPNRVKANCQINPNNNHNIARVLENRTETNAQQCNSQKPRFIIALPKFQSQTHSIPVSPFLTQITISGESLLL